MARLNFSDILNRVANRVGIKQPDNYQKASLLQHIYDELIWIHGRTEDKRVITTRQAIFDGLPLASVPSVSIYSSIGEGYAGISAGFYKYRFTHKSALLGESAFVDSDTVELVTPANERLWIQNIPPRPHGVDSIEVYRTKANGSVFYLHTSLTTDATAIYDNKNDTELVTAYVPPVKYANEADIAFPSDYFILKQANFYNIDNQRVHSKESSTEQEFNNYEPASSLQESESFRDIVNGTTPFSVGLTEENIRYDGLVLHTIQDTTPPSFNYKPRVNGYLQWMYIAVPDITFTDLSFNPDVFYVFLDLLVTGATIRATKVLLRDPEIKLSEAQIQAITLTLRIDIDEHKAKMKNYAGYIKQTTDTQQVRAFHFLNDNSMDAV